MKHSESDSVNHSGASSAVIDISAVKSRILEIRGQQVLLDRDVAALYGVETKALNQAVKRNRERFYDGYILTLTAEECSRSQIVTLNGRRGSNIKYLPHAFTEKGLYMLATVLNSPRAIKATHAIIETYAEVRTLKRELLAMHREQDLTKRNSMMHRFGEALADIVMPDLATAETESSLELNFLVGKLKRTVRRVNKANPKTRA